MNKTMRQYIDRPKDWFVHFTAKHLIDLLFTLIAIGVLTILLFKNSFNIHFTFFERFSELKSFFLGVGCALVGAAAIAFSLVMFAMQVNIERMPHGLFRKFSSDLKLLGAFLATFVLSTTVAALSLISDEAWSTIAIVLASLCVLAILRLFLFAYNRALKLISPTQQLILVVNDIKKNLASWNKAAKKAVALIPTDDIPSDSKHDWHRIRFFQSNPNWMYVAQQGITHCNVYARKYAEQGDYEVSRMALSAVFHINSAYVTTKGKTFFSTNCLFDSPLPTDNFINETLEHLRQNIQIGLSRSDEQFLEQNMRTMSQLSALFIAIDYSDEYVSKFHNHLASSYLANAAEACVPYKMPDVLMEGMRLLGEVALVGLANDDIENISSLSKTISRIAGVGAVNEKYQPVSKVGVEQLAKITVELLRTNHPDIQFVAEKVREDISLIVKMHLKYTDKFLLGIHSLAPYYSGASLNGLLSRFTRLKNALLAAGNDNEKDQKIICHIEQWSNGIHRNEKELLLEAIKCKSPFTSDVIYWIGHMTGLLLAVSKARACAPHTGDELRKNAKRLIYVLDWIPDDKESVRFVSHCLTDTIFKSAIDAYNQNLQDISAEIGNLLCSWAFKAGKYQTGWSTLETALCGSVVLDLKLERGNTILTNLIQDKLSKDNVSHEIRSHAAKGLRNRAQSSSVHGYSFSAIERAMTDVDQRALKSSLEAVAKLIDPGATDKCSP